MEIKIRLEEPGDYRAVEELTREAFWGFSRPTCDEHYLAHMLRQAAAFIPQLDFVAEAQGELAGSVMYSKAKVADENGAEHEVLTFGPLSVLPRHQNKGVGSALMRRSILEARDLGYKGIVFHGHPDYYPRFGFQNAKVFQITNAEGFNYDSLMAMELYDGALDTVHGRFLEDPVFECDEKEVLRFDARFPKKESAKMVPIEVLLEKLPQEAANAFREEKIPCLAWLNRYSGREMMKWPGMNAETLEIVNSVLRQYGYCPKLLPGCAVLESAKKGIGVLVEADEGR